MLAIVLITLIATKCSVQAADDSRIDLIMKFIVNEQKPTHLMSHLCWGKINDLSDSDVKLVKQVSTIRVRSARSWQSSRYQDQGLLFLLDLDCAGAAQLLKHASSKNLFRFPYRWLVFSNSSQLEARTALEEYPLLADSELVLSEQTEDGYRLVELHKPALEAAIQSTFRGFYNGSLTDNRVQKTLFSRRRNLMGYPLTAVVVIQDSNSTKEHLEDRLEPHYDYIAKTSWTNVRLGFHMLNATPRHIWAYRWGYIVNNSWSGMIADLGSGRADVGTCCLVKADRLPVATYTDNLAPFRVRFVFRQPPLSYVANIFRLPFSTSVWVALLVCTIASTFAVWAALRWEVKHETESSHVNGSLGDAMLLTMGAFSQQGCTIEPKKASGRIMTLIMLMTLMAMYAAYSWMDSTFTGRIMTLIMFMTLMAMYAAYSANIVVLLQAPSSTIRTLAQLAHSKLTVAALDVDYNHIILKAYSQSEPVRREIYKRVDPEKGKKQFYDLNEGVQRIREGLFALHSVVEPIYRRIEDTFLEHEKCDLMEVDFLGDYDGFVPVSKTSPYLELLRVVFKQIQESGIKKAVTRRQQTPKPKCAHTGAKFSSVGLRDLMPVIFLILYGMALAFAMLLFEITLHQIIRRRKRRTTSSTTYLYTIQ